MSNSEISIEIDRVVIANVGLSSHQSDLIRFLLQAELTRLLDREGILVGTSRTEGVRRVSLPIPIEHHANENMLAKILAHRIVMSIQD